MDHHHITATVSEFCQISGIGRSLVYEMLANGRLDSILIGKRRLIVLDSYRQLVERQRATAMPAATSPPVRNKAKARVTTRS